MDFVKVLKLEDIENYRKLNYLVDYDLPELIIDHVHPCWRPSPDSRRLSDLSESEFEMIDRPMLPSIYSPDWRTKKKPFTYYEPEISLQISTEEESDEQQNVVNELDNSNLIPLNPPDYADFDTSKSTNSSKSSNNENSNSVGESNTEGKRKFIGQPKHFSFENEKTPDKNIEIENSNSEDQDRTQYDQDMEFVTQSKVEENESHEFSSRSARVQDSCATCSVVESSDFEEGSVEGSRKGSVRHSQDEESLKRNREGEETPRDYISDSGNSADISSDESQLTVDASSREKTRKTTTRSLRKIAAMRSHIRAHLSKRWSYNSTPPASVRTRSPELAMMTRDEGPSKQSPVLLRGGLDVLKVTPRRDESSPEERGPWRIAESSVAVSNAAITELLDAWQDELF